MKARGVLSLKCLAALFRLKGGQERAQGNALGKRNTAFAGALKGRQDQCEVFTEDDTGVMPELRIARPAAIPQGLAVFALIVFLCARPFLTAASPASAAAEEIPPPTTIPCFEGAYYRKAVSSMDHWTGIEGVITLPTPTFDESRRKPNGGRYLDNPSIYMGGRSGDQEIDAGLTWEVIRESDGSVTRIGKTFRPFWRNEGWHSAPAKPEFYYFPGDTVRMRCTVAGPGKLRLEVDLLERANHTTTGTKVLPAHSESGNLRSSDTNTSTGESGTQPFREWSYPKPLSTFSADFDAREFGPDAIQQFKRVNAIDQSGNEGKPVQPTKTHVDGAIWHEVWLLRGPERLPMIPKRFTDMRCPDPTHVVVSPAGPPGLGGERISIYGTPPKNR